MTLPPCAAPRPRPPPPMELDEAWAGDRRWQVQHMLDWLSDKNRMPEGLPYLPKGGHTDTHAKAYELLTKALESCLRAGTTEKHPIGWPVVWAILLAQQAHAALHRWEMDAAGARASRSAPPLSHP